ncbi:hypothetical protein Tsubulata_030556 [Turnera subulata]|uniref:DNA topoisomerase n=1 Tax=Turnera subulata TaxID=218843 RepID=A0A9Q0F738_9ROSI|nr:hypothetical protein Tsubulata_030556 [Turnera subulata]
MSRMQRSFRWVAICSSLRLYPYMTKLQSRAFHLPFGSSTGSLASIKYSSQLKLRNPGSSSTVTYDRVKCVSAVNLRPGLVSCIGPGNVSSHWPFNYGGVTSSLFHCGAFSKRHFSQMAASSNKNRNVGVFSKHWAQPKPLDTTGNNKASNNKSRVLASSDVVDAISPSDQVVGDVNAGSSASTSKTTKSKTKARPKKQASAKKTKEKPAVNAALDEAPGSKSSSKTKKSKAGKSGPKPARVSESDKKDEVTETSASAKHQSKKKSGKSRRKKESSKEADETAQKSMPQQVGKLKPLRQATLKQLYPPTGKSVVVVESVTKAKVIQGYLGDMYEVLPSYGHVRDLAARSGSVRPDDDFSMVWEVPSAAWTHLKSIKVALGGAENLILASDPDREGEAIAWHIIEMLQQQDALHQDINVARVVFHEITEASIKNALQTPRDIDGNLVHAYLARRALDYLIGFNISPLLWRKLPGCQSAGRVQSAALSLICDRESEIDEFKPQEYWSIEAELKKDGSDSLVIANLSTFDSKKLSQLSIKSQEEAKDIEQTIKSTFFEIVGLKKNQVRRNPPAPFITSTLQQDAANKFNFSTTHTMKIAQKLYEGVQLADGKSTGLITYLRTDGLHISDEAVRDIKSVIVERYGPNFASVDARKFFKKVKNAQEAHEAIRPTNIRILPSMLVEVLDEDSLKLYSLIWSRTIACQMEPAIIEQVQVEIGNANKSIVFRSACSQVQFPGFQAAYEDVDAGAVASKDGRPHDRQAAFRFLSSLKPGDPFHLSEVELKEHFTQPPSRYSEASLVKKLEELGIGRPSTYASTLKVLKVIDVLKTSFSSSLPAATDSNLPRRDRNYLTAKNRVLHPEFRGRMVSAFLSHHFTEVTDYSFTADMENELDNVSSGLTEWKGLLKDYWTRFRAYCSSVENVHIRQVEKMLEKTFGDILFSSLPNNNRKCPSCMEGTLIFRVSRFGSGYFVGCDEHPKCKYIAKTLYGDDDDEETPQTNHIVEEPKLLGLHPVSNEKVLMKNGPYGSYVQLGEDKKGYVPKRASVSHIKDVKSITLVDAVELLRYPMTLGKHPKDGDPVIVKLAKVGFSVRHRRTIASVPKGMKPENITLEKALELLSSDKVRRCGRPKAKPKPEEAVEAM